jgi:hypothetical protein
MFGMLDYRAHKLYTLLISPVIYLLVLLSFFVPAASAYLLGLWITKDAILFPITVIVAWIVIGFLWSFLVDLIILVPKSIFNFLVDPIPADGRTKEQALAVVMGGQKAILYLKFDKAASEWSDDDIESMSRVSFFSRIFKHQIQKRIYRLRHYFCENTQVIPSEYQIKKLLKEWNLSPPWYELILTNSLYRIWSLQILILLLIIIYAPR